MNTIERFEVGSRIKNNKTGKIGIVVSNDTAGYYWIRYHLVGTPNCIHICTDPEERFEIIGEEL